MPSATPPTLMPYVNYAQGIGLSSPLADVYVPHPGVNFEQARKDTKILAIFAHAGNAEICCFPEILANHTQGKGFSALIVTDGVGSPGTPWRPKAQEQVTDVIKTRQREQRDAAFIGHYSVVFQLAANGETLRSERVEDYAVAGSQKFDASLRPKALETTKDIYRVLMATHPEQVITHQPFDSHPHHRAVLLHTLQAIALMPKDQRPKQIVGAEIWEPIPPSINTSLKYNDTQLLQYNLLDTKARDELWRKLLERFRSKIGLNPFHIGAPARAIATKVFCNPFKLSTGEHGDGMLKRLDIAPIIDRAENLMQESTTGEQPERLSLPQALSKALEEYMQAITDYTISAHADRTQDMRNMVCVTRNSPKDIPAAARHEHKF